MLIGLIALGVRLLYILAIAPAPTGVGGDAGFYHSSANLIAHGHFLYRGIFGHAYRTAEHPPLYPLVLSLSSLAGGDTLLAHRIVSCVIGSCGVILVGILGRQVADDRAGLIAGAIAAVYPPFVTADGLVMSEPLFVVTVAGALIAALALLRHPTTARAALLGAVIGCATLTRGEGILLLGLLAWPTAIAAQSAQRARRVLAATAATALVLAPWVIRNVVVFHTATLAADSNTVIAGANCHDTYFGHDIGWWSNRCLERARTRQQLLVGDASTSAAYTYAGDHLRPAAARGGRARAPHVQLLPADATRESGTPPGVGRHRRSRLLLPVAAAQRGRLRPPADARALAPARPGRDGRDRQRSHLGDRTIQDCGRRIDHRACRRHFRSATSPSPSR